MATLTKGAIRGIFNDGKPAGQVVQIVMQMVVDRSSGELVTPSNRSDYYNGMGGFRKLRAVISDGEQKCEVIIGDPIAVEMLSRGQIKVNDAVCLKNYLPPKDDYPPIVVDLKFAASMNEKVGEPVDWEAPAAAGGAASGGATSVASRKRRLESENVVLAAAAAAAAAAEDAKASAAQAAQDRLRLQLLDAAAGLIDPQLIARVKQATVRIGVLDRSTERMINLGSGVIVDAGAGAPTGQVLTAAHNFIDPKEDLYWPGEDESWPNPRYLEPYWTPGLPEDIDWSSDTAPLIIAVGIYEADGGPSKWAYWAELVTPLATLQELRPSPHDPPGSPPTQLLDLSVIRIRGNLELDPPTYSGMSTDYSLKKKHAASLVNGHAVLNPPLPDGLPLRDLNAEPLTVNVDMVNSFGWPSPDGETTLHADGAKPVQALALGLMMSELTFHFGDSGGPAVDRLGRLFGIISKSFTPTMPRTNQYKSYVRLGSELLTEHGLEIAEDGDEAEAEASMEV